MEACTRNAQQVIFPCRQFRTQYEHWANSRKGRRHVLPRPPPEAWQCGCCGGVDVHFLTWEAGQESPCLVRENSTQNSLTLLDPMSLACPYSKPPPLSSPWHWIMLRAPPAVSSAEKLQDPRLVTSISPIWITSSVGQVPASLCVKSQ